MLATIRDWLDHRLGYRKLMDAMLLEHIPGGAKWRYVWGSCLAFVFMIQVVTGLLLMMHYSPGDSTAWGSVYYIQYEMDFGWLIRGLHHFGSQTMVVLLGIHMLQVVIAGAQLPPREFNWWLGLGLMAVVLGLGLTGYLLPWDQKGYYATRVATNIAGNMPVIGDFLQRVVVGGPEYGHHTLTQFFTLHVGILPATLVVLLIAHIAIFRRHGVTTPPNAKGTGWFWPEQAFRDLVASLLVFAVMVGLVLYGHGNKIEPTFGRKGDPLGVELVSGDEGAKVTNVLEGSPAEKAGIRKDDLLYQIDSAKVFSSEMLRDALENHKPGDEIDFKVQRGKEQKDFKVSFPNLSTYEDWAHAGQKGMGANLDAPADRDTEGYPARPEWYFLFLFQLLKYFEGPLFLVGTVHIPNGVLMVLILLPLLGYGRMRKFGHAVGVFVVVALLLGVGTLTFLAILDDSDQPILGLTASNQKKAEDFRKALAKADVEAARAVQLAHYGIPEEGARELLRNDPLTKGPKIFQAKCASCHAHDDEPTSGDSKGKVQKFASDLTGYGTEKWIRGLLKDPSSPKYFGLATKTVKDDKGMDVEVKLTGMINWRKNVERDRGKLKKKDAAEAEKLIQKEEEDFDLIAQFLAEQGKPKLKRDKALIARGKSAFSESCSSCHSIDGEGSSTAPDLTDYGSSEWIRIMILSPSSKTRHSDKNLMPAFRPKDGPAAEAALEEFKLAYPNMEKHPGIMELSDIDREVLIRWLIGDTNRVVFGGQPISGPARGAKSK